MNPFKKSVISQSWTKPSTQQVVNMDINSNIDFPNLVPVQTESSLSSVQNIKLLNYADTTKKVNKITVDIMQQEEVLLPGWTHLSYDDSRQLIMEQSPEIFNYDYMGDIYRRNNILQNMYDRWDQNMEYFIEINGEDLYLRTYFNQRENQQEYEDNETDNETNNYDE